jgi:GT2 family glycosyltransferase
MKGEGGKLHPSSFHPSSFPMIDLSIIIVTWNVWPLLRGCLDSLAAITSPTAIAEQVRTFGPKSPTGEKVYTLEVIVVDNAGRDATAAELPHLYPWVRFLRSEENLGFTGGNNLGYSISQGAHIFFLNPDTVLLATPDTADLVGEPIVAVAPDALWQLYQTLTTDATVGMVGPQLRYGDGSWQNNRRRLPTLATGFWESTWLGRLWPGNPWAQRYHMREYPATAMHEVEWIMGSAMMARRVALEAARVTGDKGPFDEAFFMYSEETDLCHRLRLAGWRILYDPVALVMHYEGRSSEQVVAARHIRFNSSKVYYYQKYFGRGWATMLRHYLLLEFRLQLLLEWGKLQMGHNPELRRARMAAYRQVLQSQLIGR